MQNTSSEGLANQPENADLQLPPGTSGPIQLGLRITNVGLSDNLVYLQGDDIKTLLSALRVVSENVLPSNLPTQPETFEIDVEETERLR